MTQQEINKKFKELIATRDKLKKHQYEIYLAYEQQIDDIDDQIEELLEK